MILFVQNSANRFVLTLSEKVTLSTPFFLFHFKSVSEQKSYYCIINDISLFKRRYNEFIFTEGVDDSLNGSLILGANGQYNYNVYEQASSTNLDPLQANKLLESGFMDLDRGNTTYSNHTVKETYSSHKVT